MKTSFKKLTCLFLSILMIMSVMAVGTVNAANVDEVPTGADTVYVDASGISENYSYFAWIWQDSAEGSWHSMTLNGSYYELSMTKDDSVVFVAMPAGTKTPDWNSQVGQTENTGYDGESNYCALKLGGAKGLEFDWAVYNNGTVGTTAKPTYNTLPAPTTASTAPNEEETTIETYPVADDEDKNLYVYATSNLDLKGVKTKTEGNTISVSYSLTASKLIDGGQAVITYDTTKLYLSSALFPNLSGVVYNPNTDIGEAKFNFSGINNDFTTGKVFVDLVFERKYNEVGTAVVNLEVTDLSSKNTTYVEDGIVESTEGISFATAVAGCEPVEPSSTAVVTDATTDITIRASSNIDATVTDIKVDKANVKVTYFLTADEFIAYGNGSVSYDENMLALEDQFNNSGTIFTTVTSGASYNLNAAVGTMKFAFNGIDAVNRKGLFDFTKGGALVTLMFTVKSGATGVADVKLNIEELGAFSKEFVSQSEPNEGVAVTVSGETEQATTAEPTDVVIATGVATAPLVTTESTEATTESTVPSSETESTVPSSSETESTAPITKPVAKKPTIKAKKSTLKAGQKTTVKVSNASGKKITYSTSKKKVVSVDKKGNVKALGKGTAYIYAKVSGYGKIKCKIKVTTSPVLMNGKKKVKSIVLKKNSTKKITIKGKVSDIKNVYKNTKTAKFVSKKNTSVLKIKGLKKGKTTISVKVNKYYTLKLKVKVK